MLGFQCETRLQKGQPPGICECFAGRSSALADAAYHQSWNGHIDGPGGAIALFQAALGADPASPYRWCDLGEAYLAAGRPEPASRCLARAVELGPNLPQILLRAGNLAFRIGADGEAVRRFARVLALTPEYDAAIFSSYDRMGVPAETILAEGLPRQSRAVSAYFRHVLATGTTDGAAQTWESLRGHSFASDGLAAEYAAFLAAHQMFADAAKVWAAQLGAREPNYLKSNFLANGNFEREPSGSIFDWRITQVAGVRVTREAQSLRIDFSGGENLDYHQISQAAFVQPGSYLFTASVRTEGITTDQGLGFRIVDRENPQRLEVRTGNMHGTSGWTPVTAEIRVPPGTSLLEIQVVRPQSGRFDNKILGSAWITGVKLERVKARP